MTNPANAISVLTESVNHKWVDEFTHRGREYQMVPGGASSFYAKNGVEHAQFSVWRRDVPGIRTVTVRESDRVEVLTRA